MSKLQRPCRKVGIFRPWRAADRHGAGQRRPIISITDGNALQSLLLKPCIEFKFKGLNNRIKRIQVKAAFGNMSL
ncbi:MAG: hypothetical protein A2496_01315 [Burkholderiales bacterium RIFOXYC12_FULL_60_6]|nr:MAG: hypothetical protein A2503_09330 [Burkholderiales bacterium RIFOXYD12_FULL_59_19]OGB82718.1 MAG: hypothetical protein A2496_01315 [Burkholderiales bacterium RIFOXYC12_FULL_60_6]